MSAERLQDVGRPHRRARGTPAPETEELLERYRSAMRAELADLLEELRPSPRATGQLAIDGTIPAERLGLEARRARWELAMKLGRELSSVTLEPGWAGSLDSAPALSGRRADVSAPRLTARERRALGAE